MSLVNIRKKTIQKAPKMALFAEMGLGKTYHAAKLTAPIFEDLEDGMGKVKTVDGKDPHAFSESKSYNDVIKNIDWLVDNEHEYKTYVLDSLSKFELFVWQEVMSRYNVKDMKANWYAGYDNAVDIWLEYLKKLELLREKGIAIMLIGHVHTETVDDPSVEMPYRRYVLDVHKKARPEITQWLDCLFFAQMKKGTVIVKQNGKTETKVKQSAEERIVWCNEQIFCQAKNRYGLPDQLPLDWDVIRQEMKK
tara:strand:+ start:36 stop:785 length:750 start_codon:yes stop_codon:yes gene_type:complete